jgi:hypothetical protein
VDPHVLQKWKVMVLPLSAVRVHVAELPARCDLLATEARLVADHGTGAALAFQTVTHGNAHGLALNGQVELAAIAGGSATGHKSSDLSVACSGVSCNAALLHERYR